MRGSDRYFVTDVSCRLYGTTFPVVDMSIGGFFVASEHPPLANPLLEAELALGGRPSFRVLGRVSWVNNATRVKSKALPPGFGVQITRIDFTDKLAIVDMLRRSPRESLRSAGEA
jgi:PilZ domain